MNDAKSPCMGSIKELADKLIKEAGSHRKAGIKFGIPATTIQYWSEGAHRLQKTIDALDKLRKQRKMSKSQAWDEITTGVVEKKGKKNPHSKE
jgi:hypothetical protein